MKTTALTFAEEANKHSDWSEVQLIIFCIILDKILDMIGKIAAFLLSRNLLPVCQDLKEKKARRRGRKMAAQRSVGLTSALWTN